MNIEAISLWPQMCLRTTGLEVRKREGVNTDLLWESTERLRMTTNEQIRKKKKRTIDLLLIIVPFCTLLYYLGKFPLFPAIMMRRNVLYHWGWEEIAMAGIERASCGGFDGIRDFFVAELSTSELLRSVIAIWCFPFKFLSFRQDFAICSIAVAEVANAILFMGLAKV